MKTNEKKNKEPIRKFPSIEDAIAVKREEAKAYLAKVQWPEGFLK